MKFWKTKRGKILSHGIHEHNSGIGLIGSNLYLLKKEFCRKEKLFTKKEHERMLNTIEKSIQKCKESIDYIYTEIRKIENEA